MSTTFAKLSNQCDILSGYQGYPGRSDNYNKIWGELEPSFEGAPYCAATVSYLWIHAGGHLPAVDHSWGFSYCPDGVNYAKRNHLFNGTGHYTAGDTLFYDWDGDGVADHTEIFIGELGGGVFRAFGGNTLPDGGGHEGCYYVHRAHGPHVMGVWSTSRYFSSVPTPAPHPVPPTNHTNPYHVPHLPPNIQRPNADGHGVTRVHYVQWGVGTGVDGIFGPITLAATRQFQHYHRDSAGRPLQVDGVVGPRTLSALEKVVHH